MYEISAGHTLFCIRGASIVILNSDFPLQMNDTYSPVCIFYPIGMQWKF